LLFGGNPYRRGGTYGGAHFASEREIRNDLKLRGDQGVILGIHRNEYLRMNEPLSVLVYAPPGSGKTAGIIIPSLLSCGNSALVHDPKGELYDKTAGFRMRNKQHIIRFEPAAAISAKWNPLGKEELPETWSERISYIDRIANNLVNAGKQGDDYWTREARSLFVFFALFLVFRDGESSLPGVREFALSQADPQGFVADLLENTPGLPQRVIEEGNGILAKSGNEFSGVFGTFKSFLNSFGDEFIAANIRASDFRLRDLRESDTTIYLVVRNSDQSRLRLFASLFFELATLVLIHAEPAPGERKVTFYLDEFVRLGNMREVLQMPAISRSFKVNVLFVVQSMSQIVDIYGQSGADQLRNTCSYHIVFAQNEQKIAEDISRSIGNRTRKKMTFSSGERNITRNTSEAEEGIPLVLSQEVMSLPAFETLVLMQSHFETPVRAKAAAWFRDAAMKKRVEESLKLCNPVP
jgi:type IV secretion system protein VirD4